MGYVVKAVSASGAQLWVSPPRPETHCNFGVRKEACVFRTPMQAPPVIEALAEECKRYGFLLELIPLAKRCCPLVKRRSRDYSAAPQERAVCRWQGTEASKRGRDRHPAEDRAPRPAR